MSANVLALSQENRRFLSCHGQIHCKSFPPSKSMALGPQGRAYYREAPQSSHSLASPQPFLRAGRGLVANGGQDLPKQGMNGGATSHPGYRPMPKIGTIRANSGFQGRNPVAATLQGKGDNLLGKGG